MDTDGEDSPEVVPSKRRFYCPHCSQNVGSSTFYRHRGRYYDPATKYAGASGSRYFRLWN